MIQRAESQLLSGSEIDHLTPIQRISDQTLIEHSIALDIKREDLCHPIISGNKWHKLRLNLQAAKDKGYKRVLSFGGAWSNHLHALAFLSQKEGLDCILVIRGEELESKPLNAMLKDAKEWGAQLCFITRSEFKQKESPGLLEPLQSRFGGFYVIPQGGSNAAGVEGCRMFADSCLRQYHKQFNTFPDYVALAAGSGTMAAGFAQACATLGSKVCLRVYPALDDPGIESLINHFAKFGEHGNSERFSLQIARIYPTRFGKTDERLRGFMFEFEKDHKIPLDPVYNSKLMFGVYRDIKDGYFQHEAGKESRILAIHSGGLQGLRSY